MTKAEMPACLLPNDNSFLYLYEEKKETWDQGATEII